MAAMVDSDNFDIDEIWRKVDLSIGKVDWPLRKCEAAKKWEKSHQKLKCRCCSDVKSFFDSFPAGFRFHPTDAEHIVYYLRKKVMNEALPLNMVIEIELRHHNPETIAVLQRCTRELDWRNFTSLPQDIRNIQKGIVQSDPPVMDTGKLPIVFNGKVVGFKKSLVFYEGKPPKGRKTNWIMHEFRVKDAPPSKTSSNSEKLDDWCLCSIYNKVDNKPRKIFLDSKENSVLESFINVDCDNGVNGSMESDNASEDYMHQILQNPFIEISQLGEIQASINAEYQALTSSLGTDDAFSTNFEDWEDIICRHWHNSNLQLEQNVNHRIVTSENSENNNVPDDASPMD
ncbi:protein ATAF2-like [Pistacia vera]|uniref:protein ATAF2-like n=1 Tax=Pistacia vera TaxID=55513 RepID=UPI001263C567|nr:protein ATAF2-like [Pistacia vera]